MVSAFDAILAILPNDGRVAYSVREIAQMTGLSERTIHRRIKAGTIPVIRSEGRTLIAKPTPNKSD